MTAGEAHENRIHLEALGHRFEVASLDGTEEISALFRFEALVVALDFSVDSADLCGADAQIVFSVDGEETRRIGGRLVEVVERLDLEDVDQPVFSVILRPRVHRWEMHVANDIIMDVSIPGVIERKLTALGFERDKDFELRLGADYPNKEFIVQYKESDHAFVSRTCEHVGISYFFDHRNGLDVMVFSDDPSGFSDETAPPSVAFRGRGSRYDIYELSALSRIIPNHFVQVDYNYRKPSLDLMSDVSLSVGDATDVVEYGGHFKTQEEGRIIAQVRAEERLSTRKVYSGASDSTSVLPGHYLIVEGHPRGDISLLVTRVRHRATQTVGNMAAEGGDSYRNEFEAVPKGTPFRPARQTAKPKVHGIITGLVEASADSNYAELDDEGRYKVKFIFDTADTPDGQASRPVRMVQPHSGPGYGMHFPLRSGVEVAIACIDGDPDRPIIAGTVPNAETTSPVTSGNSARNIIRTGGGNEINIDDSEGSERIKLTTPHMSTTFQLGSPNANEAGAYLGTFGASSTVATAGVATLTSLQTSITLAKAVKTSGDITTIAKKPDRKAKALALANATDSVFGLASSSLDMGRQGMAAKVAGTTAESTIAADKVKEAQSTVDGTRTDLEKNLAAAKADGGSPPDPSLSALDSAYTALKAAEDNLATDRATAQTAKEDRDDISRRNVEHKLDASLVMKEATLADANAKAAADEASLDGLEPPTGDLRKAFDDSLARAAAAAKPGSPRAAALANMAKAITDRDGAFTGLKSAQADAASKKKKSDDDTYDLAYGGTYVGLTFAKTALDSARTVYSLFSVAAAVYGLVTEKVEQVKAVKNWVDAGVAVTDSKPLGFTDGYGAADILGHYGPLSYNLPTTHTVGSTEAMTVYGDKKMLIWCPETTIYAEKTVPTDEDGNPMPGAAYGGRLTMVATEQVVMASKKMIEITSKEETWIATKDMHLRAINDIDVEATKKISIESKDDSIAISAKTKAGQNIELEAKTKIGSTAESIESTATKEIQLTSGAAGTIAVTAGKTVTLKVGDYVLEVSKASVKISTGPSSAQVTISKSQVEVKQSATNSVVISAAGLKIKSGASEVTLGPSGTAVKGTKVLLG